MSRPSAGLFLGIGLVGAVGLMMAATTHLLPAVAQLPVVLGFVLFIPGAAFAFALRLRDALGFSVVAIGVSVALLLLLSQLTVMTVGLSPRVVLGGLVLFTMSCVAVRMVQPFWRSGGGPS
jgi:hypothetical protein